MKWSIIFSLFFLVACSTTKTGEVTPTAENVVTESEAKPVSPYTVEPCYCMKIFKPVCADGSNYGNSCEAECHGHKTWTDGPCGKTKK
jgi:hypothetical protein